MGAAPKSEIAGSHRTCIPTIEVLSLQVREDRAFHPRLGATHIRVRRYQGVFSKATSADIWNSFTDYDSGYSLLASGTWDVKDTINTDEAFWNVCYLYSDANPNATI